MRNAVATAAAAAFAVGALAFATAGFRAFTAEAARRLAVEREPRRVPEALLEDADGRRFRASDLAGRRLAVTFVYTSCPTVCRSTAPLLTRLADRLASGSAPGRAALLTVSFDPERDDPARLRAWAAAHRADGELLRVVRPARAAELLGWLETFGVVVIPDGAGGFEHNAALHLVDERGRLVRIVDVDALDEAQRFLAAEPWAAR